MNMKMRKQGNAIVLTVPTKFTIELDKDLIFCLNKEL